MTPSDLIIREPVPADGPAIGAVHVDAWQYAYADLMPAEFLAGLDAEERGKWWQRTLGLPPDGNTVLVAELDGRIVGFVVFGEPRDDVPAGTGEIAAINFAHDAWGSGYGSALFARAVQGLKARGFTGAYLWVAAGNKRAIGFYRHHGWSDDGFEEADEQRGFTIRERRFSIEF
ncbi:GNAT family N-acetyltransferase [Spelaeicoccus albus]|uniref:Ribosomal protein S18 acetylase RimI-like enzyme n=1 Tax=Spelaeicoccus albus TaxID=1280376 RepID=A0A7Z0CZF7_9MICO|nr:GNAT family N-acetyltransferase [Spelaeicoccus albus]NYI66234.1 ribosomal protein S18 acetylase RimI-like enzyme [Spelaeicoccus albus]